MLNLPVQPGYFAGIWDRDEYRVAAGLCACRSDYVPTGRHGGLLLRQIRVRSPLWCHSLRIRSRLRRFGSFSFLFIFLFRQGFSAKRKI